MVSILGSDITIDFFEADIVYDSDSDFKVISEEDNLSQAIKNRLLTKKGELYSHVNYGSNLYLLIGQTMDSYALNLAGSYIYDSLSYEERITSVNELNLDFRLIDSIPTLIIFLKVTTQKDDTPLNLVINYNI